MKLNIFSKQSLCVILQSWARVNCLASRQRQLDNVIGTKKIRKMFRSRCLDATTNTYIHNAITNNFVAWKHGHIVAAVLSRVQLCYYCRSVHYQPINIGTVYYCCPLSLSSLLYDVGLSAEGSSSYWMWVWWMVSCILGDITSPPAVYCVEEYVMSRSIFHLYYSTDCTR